MPCSLSAVASIVGGQVRDVLIAQRGRDAAHGGMGARPGLVVVQGMNHVVQLLAAKLRYRVDLRIGGAVTRDPVAALAHRGLVLALRRIAVRPGRGAEYDGCGNTESEEVARS